MSKELAKPPVQSIRLKQSVDFDKQAYAMNLCWPPSNLDVDHVTTFPFNIMINGYLKGL